MKRSSTAGLESGLARLKLDVTRAEAEAKKAVAEARKAEAVQLAREAEAVMLASIPESGRVDFFRRSFTTAQERGTFLPLDDITIVLAKC